MAHEQYKLELIMKKRKLKMKGSNKKIDKSSKALQNKLSEAEISKNELLTKRETTL